MLALYFLVLFVFIPISGQASKFLGQDKALISGNEVIEDDIYIFCDNGEFYGEVIGDYTGFIYRSTIDGVIDGNLNLAANRVDFEGEINKSARIIGQEIDINGLVNNDLTAFGETITISRRTVIGRDLTAFGSVIYVDGTISGTARIWAGTIIISGQIGEDVIIEADEITIENGAVINGSLEYKSKNKAIIEDGAQIDGSIKQEFPEEDERIGEIYSAILAVARLIFFVMALVTGLVLIALFNRHAKESGQYIQNKFGYAIGIGFMALFTFTAGAVLLAVLVVGLPLSIILILTGIIFFYIGKIYCSIAIGMAIFSMFGQKDIGPAWSFIIGLIVLSLLFAIPVIGTVVYLLAFLIGAGGAIGGYLTICRKCRDLSLPTTEAPPPGH